MGGCTRKNLQLSHLIHYLVILTLNASIFIDGMDGTRLDVFILSGQSNMSGRGGVEGDKWDGFVPNQCRPHPSIFRFSAEEKWVEAREPLHKDIDTKKVCGVGPGMAFANRLLKESKDFGDRNHIGLVPCAIGGTAIKEWEKGSFLYTTMINRTMAALGHNNGSSNLLRALLWYQGETDANSEETADIYHQNLERFIHDVRSDLKQPDLLFIQVAITMGVPPYTEPVQKVREAQLGMRIHNVYCVDANGLALKEDKLHLTTESQVILGKHLADMYIKHGPSSKC